MTRSSTLWGGTLILVVQTEPRLALALRGTPRPAELLWVPCDGALASTAILWDDCLGQGRRTTGGHGIGPEGFMALT